MSDIKQQIESYRRSVILTAQLDAAVALVAKFRRRQQKKRWAWRWRVRVRHILRTLTSR